MKHHTKNKGDLGVAKAIADLTEKDYLVLIPAISEHAPFDLVVYKDTFTRIQVKYRKMERDGTISLKFRSTGRYTKRGTFNVPVDKSQLDAYCIYCPDTNQCYYINPSEFDKAVNLRILLPKNGQTKLINMADDYIQPCF